MSSLAEQDGKKPNGLTSHVKDHVYKDNYALADIMTNIMRVALYRDGFVEMETAMDYLKDGATAVGNATAEEMQFVMAFVVKRPMTQQELDAEHEKREKAVDMAMEKAILF